MPRFKEGDRRTKELASKGGKARARQMATPKMDRKALGALETPEDAKRLLALVAHSVLTGDVDEKGADVAIRAVRAWLEAHASSLTTQGLDDLMRRLDELERAAKSGRPSLEVS